MGEGAPRSSWRRWALRILGVPVWLVLALLSIVASVLLHFDTAPTRTVVCDEARRFLDEELRGDFQIDRCVTITLREVHIEGFRARAPNGREVLSVRSLVARPRLRQSLTGVIHLDGAELEVDHVDLRELDDLIETFEPTIPSDTPPDDDPVVLPRIEVGAVRVRVGRVFGPEVTLDEVPLSPRAEDVRLDGHVSLGPSVEVSQLVLSANAFDGESALLKLGVSGHVNLDASAPSTLEWWIASADGASVDRAAGRNASGAADHGSPGGAATARPPLGAPEVMRGDGTMTWGETIDVGPDVLDVGVDARIEPELVRALGLPELAGLLAGPVTLALDARGPLSAFGGEGALSAEGVVRAPGGELSLDARYEADALEARVATTELALDGVLATLPDATVDADVHATLAEEEGGWAARVEARGLRYDVWVLDAVEADALLAEDGRIVLRAADIPHLSRGGHFRLQGELDGETIRGQLDMNLPQLARDPNLRRVAPGVDARLRADLHFSLTGERISAQGSVEARSLRAPGIRAERLGIRGYVRGAISGPRVELDVTEENAVFQGEPVERLALRVVGGPQGGGVARYTIVGEATTRGRRVEADLAATIDRAGYGADGELTVHGVWPTPVRARLSNVRYEREVVRIGAVALRDDGGALGVTVRGVFAPSGRSDLHVLADADLVPLGHALATLGERALSDLGAEGRAHVEAQLEGTTRAPSLLVSATVAELRAGTLAPSELRLQASYTPEGVLGAQLGLRGAGELDVRVDAQVDGNVRRPTPADLADGTWNVGVDARSLDLAVLEALGVDLPARGEVDVRLVATGLVPSELDAAARGRALPPDERSLELDVNARDLRIADGDPLTVDVDAHWDGARADVTLDAADERGPLGQIRAEMPLAPADLGGLDVERLASSELRVELALVPRRLDEWPSPLRQGFPLRAGVSGTIEGDPSGPRVALRFEGGWEGESFSHGCANATPTFTGELALAEGQATLGLDLEANAARPPNVGVTSADGTNVSSSDSAADAASTNAASGQARTDASAAASGQARTDASAAAASTNASAATTNVATTAAAPNAGAGTRGPASGGGASPAMGSAHVDIRAPADVLAWLTQGFTMPEVELDLRSSALPLAGLPYACEHATGALTLSAEARGLLGPRPRVVIDGDIPELRMRGRASDEVVPMHAILRAAATPEEGSVSLSLRAHADAFRARRRGEARASSGEVELVALRGAIPWRWGRDPDAEELFGPGALAPEIADDPWDASVELHRAPIAPFVALVPGLEDPQGTVDGRFEVRGRGIETPTVTGRVALSDIGLTVRDPFVRVERLNGAITLREDAILLEEVRYVDQGGSLTVDGRVGLAGLGLGRSSLRVRARRMPTRVEGVIFAWVTADVAIEADLDRTDRRTIDIELREVAILVPEQMGRTLQSLDQHGDVTYVDALPGGTLLATSRSESEREEDADAEEPSVPLLIRVRSTPFWVRRDDFAIQLQAEVEALTEEGEARIEGPVRVRRGYLELLGKRFELEPGEVRFAGGSNIDPRLELTALHTLRTGERVYVDIGGFLSAPTIAFRSPDVIAGDDRAVIDLLVRGRPQQQAETEARDQATSVLAGMLAGFLSSMTRRELGAFLPVFRIEAEDARTARVRAGFTADRLIPSWLEGIVRGLYVEGFVGTEEQSGQSRAAGGFLLEMLFPFNLVGTGKWEQGNNWGVSVTWEPL